MNNNLVVLVCVGAEFLSMVVVCHDAQRLPPGVSPTQYQQQPHQHQQQQQYQQQQQFQQQQQQYQQQQQQFQQQPPPNQQQQRPPPPPQQQQQQQQQQVPMQQGQGPPHHHDPHAQPQQLLNAANIAQEKEHIQEHLHVPIDTSKMTEQELQFHYFKMHDADNNNKLDGCELIKSLIHWHDSNEKETQLTNPHSDDELQSAVDPLLISLDSNYDGFVEFTEYINGKAF